MQLESVVDPRPVRLNLSSEECVVTETEKIGDLYIRSVASSL